MRARGWLGELDADGMVFPPPKQDNANGRARSIPSSISACRHGVESRRVAMLSRRFADDMPVGFEGECATLVRELDSSLKSSLIAS
jgi:hypothetical protein